MNHLMANITLTGLDWSFIIGFFVVAIGIGIYTSKSAGKSEEDFFLGGRSMPWWLLGFSMVATTFSTDTPNFVTDIIRKVNRIRKENLALQSTWNLHITRTDNEQLMGYIKLDKDNNNPIWCIVNFDADHTQSGYIEVPKALLGIDGRISLKVTDLLTNEVYHWFNDWNFVELNPHNRVAHILKVEKTEE